MNIPDQENYPWSKETASISFKRNMNEIKQLVSVEFFKIHKRLNPEITCKTPEGEVDDDE